eukprot:CAMPEP_0171056160 /NCGR_PEP_ID=MMETSP0766_2-20121228/250_1 /TAXON_ID=439317 /ORGANISM="Gambierdiscus australes, Strain CAWD 149" /LENGTH=40 /DNA_ID= /DNA_START= /DNA_END= /DNA_ORIENTATION=
MKYNRQGAACMRGGGRHAMTYNRQGAACMRGGADQAASRA